MTIPRKPVVLCILDGWGIAPDPEFSGPDQAQIPVFRRLVAECPHATLTTFGPDAGLPKGQMGNSEVGHTNIGAGRVVAMDLGQIDLAIEDGSFAKNATLNNLIEATRKTGGRIHLMGLVSDGGVHGHIAHIIAAAKIIAAAGVQVQIHAVSDGRDVAPGSAEGFIRQLAAALPADARIGTVSGRYYAMDRDNRWERVEKATSAMLHGEGRQAPDPVTAVLQAAAQGESDEFILPTVLPSYIRPETGDSFLCMNFRADRARQIMAAIAQPGFDAFDTGPRPLWAGVAGMADYSKLHDEYMGALYPKRPIENTLGAWVASKGLRQFRLAETEKYPHVTFFLNGGKEAPEQGEDRHMPASPKVATYDLAPEMASVEVGDALVGAIEDGYDLIVVNFANPDMVGHSGDLAATAAACAAVDLQLGRMIEALEKAGGAAVICADHGNAEMMRNPDTGMPHTAHTLNPVPVILYNGPEGAVMHDGRLADLAPTVLALMGIAPPADMTGSSLFTR